MDHTIGVGETIVIPQREITEEMHDLRVVRVLVPKNNLQNGAKAKILRAYTRPRDQEVVEVEQGDEEVRVTALAKGHATVDIIDEISEPWGYDTEIYVVREPQQDNEAKVVVATAKAPVEVASAG